MSGAVVALRERSIARVLAQPGIGWRFRYSTAEYAAVSDAARRTGYAVSGYVADHLSCRGEGQLGGAPVCEGALGA